MLSDIFGLNQMVIVRILLAALTSFLVVMLSGNKFILFLKKHQHGGQPIRDDGPQSHLSKKGTPTMGGILILVSIFISTIMWSDISDVYIWICMGVMLIYGLTGYIDDNMKVKKKSANAMTAKMKLLIQFSTAFVAVLLVWLYSEDNMRNVLYFPFFDYAINISWFYIVFTMIVVTGSSNAVNLTDGLDGLAAGLCIFAFVCFAFIAYVFGSSSNPYEIFIPGCKEMAIVCASVAGSCLGFLWFNSYPAKVFMGDTGSLALGALLGILAVMTKGEFVLAIAGLVFVAEAISVMLQIFWYKKTKKRIFLMAPIHHHFEQLGWHETTVVIRFWIIGLICALIGISSILI